MKVAADSQNPDSVGPKTRPRTMASASARVKATPHTASARAVLVAVSVLSPVAGAIAQEAIDLLAVVNALRTARSPSAPTDFEGPPQSETVRNAIPSPPPSGVPPEYFVIRALTAFPRGNGHPAPSTSGPGRQRA